MRHLIDNDSILNHIKETLTELGLGNLQCPLAILKELADFKVETPKQRVLFHRIQQLLQKSLSKDELDSPWDRGRICELLLCSFLQGESVGSRGSKTDIIRGPHNISVKIYSDKESRIQCGNLPKNISPRSSVKEFVQNWNRIFLVEDMNTPLTHSGGRRILWKRKPLCDLNHERGNNPHCGKLWELHMNYHQRWRNFLSGVFNDLTHWCILYIDKNTPEFKGMISIDWFDNDTILDALSPIDRPPPIFFQTKTNFRISADILKRNHPRSDDYLSGSFDCQNLFAKNPTTTYDLELRERVSDLILSLSQDQLHELECILQDIKS